MATETSVRPVFLVGAARSGTSLLFRTMALHPEVTWLSNWVQRFPRVPQLNGLNRVARALPERRSRVWFGAGGDNAYVYGRRRPLHERLMPQPVEAETLYHRAGIPELGHDTAEVVPDEAVARLRRAFETASRWDGRTVHVAKRIANNRRIPLLQRAFPDAWFVEIVRDGRAVASSLSQVDWWAESDVWWYGGNPAGWREDGGDEWELCARNWVEEVRALRQGLEEVPADRRLSISYEDLVQAPHPTLAAVVEFTGLDADDARFTTALDAVRFPNKNERWRSALDAAALTTVERVQREELLHYGYVPETESGQTRGRGAVT